MSDGLKLSSGVAFVASYQALAPVAFTPEGIHLGDFVFLPYVRNGLSAAITEQPNGNRITIRAEVELADSNKSTEFETVRRDLTLFGPGDVTGIDASQIIRREPAANTVDAEEGYLAHIEFARPDFPWLFSPLPAHGDICQPWLALVVCEASVSHLEPSEGERPARIWTRKGQLQPLTDQHLYAHAQVVGAALSGEQPVMRGAAQDSVETRLSDDHAPANLSRILCPRRLDDGKSYIVALVPTFDCGVKSGLGLGGGTLAPAWTRVPGDEADDIVLPAYESWTFRTATGGNFRELATRIKPVGAPWSVGRLSIDLSNPGSGIPAMALAADGGVQVLECALFSPAKNGPVAPAPWPLAARAKLRDRVDAANVNDNNLPRIGARLYARYQRAANRLGEVFVPSGAADADWFSALNTNPMHRIVAGLGARVVQKDQELLMQAAWAQVEGIRRTNQVIAWAALAERVNLSIMDRHIKPLDQGRLMQVTRNLQGRIRDGVGTRSLASAVTFSRTADSTLGAAFRRALRPDGTLAKRAELATTSMGTLVADAAGFRDHRIDYHAPDGITDLSATGRKYFSIEVIAKVMAVPVNRANAALDRQIAVLVRSGPAVKALQAERWTNPVRDRIGDAIGAQMLDTITKSLPAPRPDAQVSGTELLAQITVGLQHSGGALADAAALGLDTIIRVTPIQDLGLAISPGVRPTLSPNVHVPLQPNPQTPDLQLRPLRRGGPEILNTQPPLRLTDPATVPALQRFETDLSRSITTSVQALNRLDAASFAQEVRLIASDLLLPPKAVTDPGALMVTRPGVLAQIDPIHTARAAFRGRISQQAAFLPVDWFDRVGLAPIMAAPVFNRPMYEALNDLDRDWLVPGLGQIAERDFVTLLTINPGFAEAFLIGASDEMGRELLWRDYPTDQRGTYFKRFWDADEDELKKPIHQFSSHQPLSQHFSIGGNMAAGAGVLALVVRGELLRRFPDTFIAAMKSENAVGPPTFIADSERRILFHAHLDPDYVLVGFDLTEEMVMGPDNWWFVLAQHPTAPRFGLETDQDQPALSDFGSIPPGGFLVSTRSFAVANTESRPQTVRWPGHAGVVARVLLSNPYRAAYRAKNLIASVKALT